MIAASLDRLAFSVARLVSLFSFLSVVVLADPSFAQETLPTPSPEPTISVEAGAADDQKIRERIRSILSEIDGLGDVTVSVNSGVVTLGGVVLDDTQGETASSLARRVEGVVSVRDQIARDDSVAAQLDPAVERIKARTARIVALAPLVLISLAVFGTIVLAGFFLTRSEKLWLKIAPNAFIADIYRAVARLIFVIVGIVVALDLLNATALIGAVLGVAGVAGLAVGFAVRDTVENFIASILLSLRQPFRPDDLVEIDGLLGNVARLTARATVLISPDGNHIRVPNATVFKGTIINYTRQPERRFTFDLGVDADSDLGKALSTAVEAVDALPFVLSAPPISAWIAEVGDSNVVLTFAAWINQTETHFNKARGEAIRAAKTALEEAGFGLPEPIYRLKIDGAGQVVPTGKTGQAKSAPPPHLPEQSAAPDAARPENRDTAPSEAAAQERATTDASEDLLSTERASE